MTIRKTAFPSFAALAVAFALQAGSADARSALESLTFDTASGAHTFHVEVMHSEADRARGLMYRRSMPHDHGMLFDFQTEQPVTFWMENTLIPLDMVFVDKAGQVVGIKHDAKPMDRTLIPSGAPTLGVVEVNAGVTNEIGLKVGDHVKNALFH